MLETDYPHTDTTWPDCIDVAKKLLADLPPETQYKIQRGNAEKLFRFTPAEPHVAAGARACSRRSTSSVGCGSSSSRSWCSSR